MRTAPAMAWGWIRFSASRSSAVWRVISPCRSRARPERPAHHGGAADRWQHAPALGRTLAVLSRGATEHAVKSGQPPGAAKKTDHCERPARWGIVGATPL